MNPHGLQPRRRPARHSLLVHLLPCHTRREPVQHARPVAEGPDDPVANRDVVADQVKLGPSAGRKVHPVGVADPDRPLPDLDIHMRGHAAQASHTGAMRADNPATPQQFDLGLTIPVPIGQMASARRPFLRRPKPRANYGLFTATWASLYLCADRPFCAYADWPAKISW